MFIIKLKLKQRLLVYVCLHILARVFSLQAVLFTYNFHYIYIYCIRSMLNGH